MPCPDLPTILLQVSHTPSFSEAQASDPSSQTHLVVMAGQQRVYKAVDPLTVQAECICWQQQWAFWAKGKNSMCCCHTQDGLQGAPSMGPSTNLLVEGVCCWLCACCRASRAILACGAASDAERVELLLLARALRTCSTVAWEQSRSLQSGW